MNTTNTLIRNVANVGRRRLSSVNTAVAPPTKNLSSKHKHETNVILKAVTDSNNPRTIPRAAVWVGAASFVGFMAYRRMVAYEKTDYQKRTMMIQEAPPAPLQSHVSKTVAESTPIVLTDKYDKLLNEGLGVDHDEWKKKKMTKTK